MPVDCFRVARISELSLRFFLGKTISFGFKLKIKSFYFFYKIFSFSFWFFVWFSSCASPYSVVL